jgi:gas vesicle protein
MNKGFFIGLAAGLVVGAAAALLLAPASGRDSRKRISEATQPAREQVSKITAKVRDRARSRVESIKQAI